MNHIKRILHVLKRDIMPSLYTKRFNGFGKNSILYKPLIIKSFQDISIGTNTTILNGARFQVYNDITGLKSKIVIGDNCYLGYNLTILAGENITIEDGVLMASNILISSENHSTDPESNRYYSAQPLTCRPVVIGEGCWIGEKVCILQGVTIGKKSIIGAGSIVTRDIPDYCIATGVPAKVIKKYSFESHSWEKEGKNALHQN